jgi:hypothetical protein
MSSKLESIILKAINATIVNGKALNAWVKAGSLIFKIAKKQPKEDIT